MSFIRCSETFLILNVVEPEHPREKYLELKSKVDAALVKYLDVKFANMFYVLGILHHLLQNAHMKLD